MALLTLGCSGDAAPESASSELKPTVEDEESPSAVVSAATPEPSRLYTSIREVDFMNGFTYETGAGWLEDEAIATVRNGGYSNGEYGDYNYFHFRVFDIAIGDIDGDGVEEALVATSWNGGGTSNFDHVTAYRLDEGRVVSAGRLKFGDRAYGGIYDVQVIDGAARVWAFAGTGPRACCPDSVRSETLVLGEHFLTVTNRGTSRSWMEAGLSHRGEQLSFLPGTNSAVLAFWAHRTDASFTFQAGQDLPATFALVDGPAPTAISVTDLSSGEVFDGTEPLQLPADAAYDVFISFDDVRDQKTTMELTIGADSPVAPVAWSSILDQEIVTEDPLAQSSLSWPAFYSGQPGVTDANSELAEYVFALDDAWVQAVTEFSSPHEDGGRDQWNLGASRFDMHYEVRLASSEVVAVQFDFWSHVCCNSYRSFGSRSVVVDLAAGRLLPQDEILDMDRYDKVIAIWVGELDARGELRESVEAVLGQNPEFDSLGLTPGGVEFRVSWEVPSDWSGTSIVVPYEQLGDLVNPALVARIAAG